jgi:5-methylcytosine-specific restriction protein A
LKIYNEKCAISATNLPPVLEAAHIVPYQGVETNNITNGILLSLNQYKRTKIPPPTRS